MGAAEDYKPIAAFIRAQKKQRLINFFEDKKRINWRFYERGGFFNVEVLFAGEFELKNIIETIPKDFYCHVSGESGRFEVFTDTER